MIWKASSKVWEGHAEALDFSAAIAPGYKISVDIKLSPVLSLTNQMVYSFSHYETGWIHCSYSPIHWEVD